MRGQSDQTTGQPPRRRGLRPTPGRHCHQLRLGDHRAPFGRYIRRLRENIGLTLRVAAERLDVSPAYLQRWEVGNGARTVSQEWIERIAVVFCRDGREVMYEAGLLPELPQDLIDAVEIERRFERLITHPSLAPLGLDKRGLAYYSLRQKQQWIDFALRLDQHVRDGGVGIREILDDGSECDC